MILSALAMLVIPTSLLTRHDLAHLYYLVIFPRWHHCMTETWAKAQLKMIESSPFRRGRGRPVSSQFRLNAFADPVALHLRHPPGSSLFCPGRCITDLSSYHGSNLRCVCRVLARSVECTRTITWAQLTSSAGSSQYDRDIAHYYDSSSAVSICSVEPGSAADVGEVVSGHSLYHHRWTILTGK